MQDCSARSGSLRKLAHLFSPQTLKGDPAPPRRCGACGRAASSRFLIVGAGPSPNRNRPPAARHCFYRPPAGAPRRLRQRSACHRVERFAHDRAAVVWLFVVRIVIAAVCGRQSFSCCSAMVALSYIRVLSLLALSLYGLLYLLEGRVPFISMIILGDETVWCLANCLPGPPLSGTHSGPLGLVGGAWARAGRQSARALPQSFCPQPHRGGQHPAYHISLSDRHPKFLYVYIIIAALC